MYIKSQNYKDVFDPDLILFIINIKYLILNIYRFASFQFLYGIIQSSS